MLKAKKVISKVLCILLTVQLLLSIWQQGGEVVFANGATVSGSVYSGVYGFTPTMVPSQPVNLSATPVSYNKISVNWKSSTGQVSQYHVFQNGRLIASVTTDVYAVERDVSYMDVGLLPSSTYTYEVEAVDSLGNTSTRTPPVTAITMVAPSESGGGRGLKAEYFNGTSFDQLKVTRLDSTVNFDWENTSPAAGVDPNGFSVRWSGKLIPKYTENYTLYTETHGGVRLWIDGVKVIDNWNTNEEAKHSGNVSLQAGRQYQVQLEYKDNKDEAKVRLLWSSRSQLKEVIPQSQLDPPFVPGIPGNVTTSSTSNTITVSWDSVTGATGYDVEVDGIITDSGTVTSFVHSVSPTSTHKYRVRAKVPEVPGDWSPMVQASSKLGAPQNVQVNSVDGGFKMSWNAVFGTTGYEVEIDGQLIDNGSSLEYLHGGLMPNTEHTYRVRAKDTSSYSDWSEIVTKTFLSNVPTNVTASSTSRSITVSWDPVAQAVGYEVESDGVMIRVALTTTFTHNGLEPNTLHMYRVRAYTADGPLGWSILIQKSTSTESGRGTGLKGTYFNEDNFIDEKSSRIDHTVNFDWKNSAPAQGVVGDYTVRWTGQVEPSFSETYTFYTHSHGGTRLWVNGTLLIDNWQTHRGNEQQGSTKKDEGGRSDIPAEHRGNDNSQADHSNEQQGNTNKEEGGRSDIPVEHRENDNSEIHHGNEQQGSIRLEAGRRYDIRLEYQALEDVGTIKLLWGSTSQAKEIIPQNQLYPIGVTSNVYTVPTETTVGLRWNNVTFADKYQVEINGTTIVDTPVAAYTDLNLTPGTAHTYRIRAISGIAIGEWSDSVSAYTLLGTTTIADLLPVETAITIRWQPVDGAEGYEIELDGKIVNNGTSTEYVHDNLLSGTEHTYRVRAKTAAVLGNWTSLVRKWTLPEIPQGVRLSAANNSVTLHWDAVRGATGYDLDSNNTIIDNGNSTQYTDGGLTSNTQHTYRIRAKNSSGVGKWTSIIAKSTLPSVPGNLNGVASDTKITVSWDASAGATAYDIEIDGSLIEDYTNISYVHAGLSPNTSHTYRVRAKNAEGASFWSLPISIITLPSIPQNLQAEVSTTQIALVWDEIPGATGYDLEVDGTVFDNGTYTTYVHSGLNSNSEHIYRVRARNGSIVGHWSEALTRWTFPAVPDNVRFVSTSSEITVTWDPVVGVAGYDLEVDGKLIDSGLNTSFIHDGLPPFTEHKYKVRSKNNVGAGEWSQTFTVSTGLDKPHIVIGEVNTSSIQISWNVVSGATNYDLMSDGEIINVGAVTTYLHNGLSPYSWHAYRVRARNDSIIGDWSDAVTKSTLLGIPTIISLDADSSQITVVWEEVVGATGYEIEVDGTIIDNAASTVFVHQGLASSSQHTYRVRAKNENGTSGWGTFATKSTTPNIPKKLTATAMTNSITLQWESVIGANSYDVEIDGQTVSRVTSASYTHQSLDPNTMHTYRVRALNESDVSGWSGQLEKATTPELTVNVGKDTIFNFVVVAPKKPGVLERKIIVTYNPEELEVLDLSAATPEMELAVGPIQGSNISISEFSNGKIVYTIANADKTAMNIIKFVAKTNEYSKITYVVE